MKSGMNDKVQGAFHEAKGKVKEVVGKAIDKPKLEAEGTVEKIDGKIQKQVGKLKTALGK
jgi:uncharacterized protein YjbJ (UPF0337 family)